MLPCVSQDSAVIGRSDKLFWPWKDQVAGSFWESAKRSMLKGGRRFKSCSRHQKKSASQLPDNSFKAPLARYALAGAALSIGALGVFSPGVLTRNSKAYNTGTTPSVKIVPNASPNAMMMASE